MDRYEISDRMCGALEFADTKAEAFRVATHFQEKHSDCLVTVYDRMAHHGQPEWWTSMGSLLKVRPQVH